MTNSEHDDNAIARRSFTARAAMLGLLLVATAFFAALGIWQVKRLAWKTDLIARVEARLSAAPVAAPSPDRWTRITAADDEYTRIALSGHFLNDKEAHVVASTELGPGYWVLTPFVQADGTVVIVNRGFVTAERRDPATRMAGQVEGDTAVTGLLRISEEASWILRKNDAAAGRWYRRVPAEIAEARGLLKVAPFFIDADARPNAGGWPVGGLTIVRFNNSHLVYAVTWLGLALLALVGAVLIFQSEFSRKTTQGLGGH
jgi:surfeit locus 1 family protein